MRQRLIHRLLDMIYGRPVLQVPDGWAEMLEAAGWRKFTFERYTR